MSAIERTRGETSEIVTNSQPSQPSLLHCIDGLTPSPSPLPNLSVPSPFANARFRLDLLFERAKVCLSKVCRFLSENGKNLGWRWYCSFHIQLTDQMSVFNKITFNSNFNLIQLKTWRKKFARLALISLLNLENLCYRNEITNGN